MIDNPCAKLCSICKIEKMRRNFPDCQDHCWGCEFKQVDDYSKLISPRIMEIFEKFKATRPRYRDAKILNDDEFKDIAEDFQSNLTPTYWAQKSLSLFFNDKQAEELWSIIKNSVPDASVYKFIHAIGPALLLAREMMNLHGVWRYYSNAKTEEQIMQQWENKWEWIYNCGSFTIDSCGICLEDIKSDGHWAICKHCQQNTHIHCKLKYLKSTEPAYSCEYCRYKYVYNNDIVLHKFDYYGEIPGTRLSMRLLSWKDHIEYL